MTEDQLEKLNQWLWRRTEAVNEVARGCTPRQELGESPWFEFHRVKDNALRLAFGAGWAFEAVGEHEAARMCDTTHDAIAAITYQGTEGQGHA